MLQYLGAKEPYCIYLSDRWISGYVNVRVRAPKLPADYQGLLGEMEAGLAVSASPDAIFSAIRILRGYLDACGGKYPRISTNQQGLLCRGARAARPALRRRDAGRGGDRAALPRLAFAAAQRGEQIRTVCKGALMRFIATCKLGLESTVARQLRQLALDVERVEDARVFFTGGFDAMARSLLWLRTAERGAARGGLVPRRNVQRAVRRRARARLEAVPRARCRASTSTANRQEHALFRIRLPEHRKKGDRGEP